MTARNRPFQPLEALRAIERSSDTDTAAKANHAVSTAAISTMIASSMNARLIISFMVITSSW